MFAQKSSKLDRKCQPYQFFAGLLDSATLLHVSQNFSTVFSLLLNVKVCFRVDRPTRGILAIDNHPELIYLQPKGHRPNKEDLESLQVVVLFAVPLRQRYDRGFRDDVKKKIMGGLTSLAALLLGLYWRRSLKKISWKS